MKNREGDFQFLGFGAGAQFEPMFRSSLPLEPRLDASASLILHTQNTEGMTFWSGKVQREQGRFGGTGFNRAQ
jgi:hypothetical protein